MFLKEENIKLYAQFLVKTTSVLQACMLEYGPKLILKPSETDARAEEKVDIKIFDFYHFIMSTT